MAEHKIQKTAVELLEELLLKQDQILACLKNIDFSQRTLLGNFNASLKRGGLPLPQVDPEQVEKQKIAEALADLKMTQSKEPTPRRREPYKDQSELVNVWQKLVTEAGGPVFLASVEIINENGEVIKKARSDASGTWKASLNPGKYTISVVKRANPNSDKQGFSTSYEIVVPRGEALVDLNYQIIKGS